MPTPSDLTPGDRVAAAGPVVVFDEAGFYAADPRRRTSDEAEYGALWRHAGAGGDDVWRLALICDTGELVLTRVDPYPHPDSEVHLLRAGLSPAEADRLLDGWQQECARPGSLEWLAERLATESPAAA